MAASDARPFPLKNVAYRVTFPILDADGDLITGAAGLDSEVSKDGGTFTDCTNEATEIATSSGVYYLDLSSAEMNADTVAIIVKTSTSGAKTTVLVLYPVEGGDIDVDVTYINGSAVSTSTAQLGVNVVQAAGTAWGSGAITSGAFASGAITAGAIAADAIGASELAADAATEIGTAVWATAARTLTAATNITSTGAAVPITAGGLVNADVAAISTDATAANNAESFFDGTGYAGTNNVIPTVTTVNGLAANSLTAAALAADAGAEIADAVWDEATAGHTGAGTTGKALTDANNGTPLDAAGVRGAIGLASANLDTQLDAIPTAVENADALLKRDWTAVTGEAARSVLNALRFLRNKWGVSGSTLTVMKEDDVTTAWTAAVTDTAGADPITGVDPS